MPLHKFKNSAWSIPLVFFFTGFLGYTAGPIVNFYLGMANGGDIVTTALAMTGITFLGLSAYAVSSRKDFSFMGGFLMMGLILVIVASLANIFLCNTCIITGDKRCGRIGIFRLYFCMTLAAWLTVVKRTTS